jgi:hypothetical protein
LVGKPSHINSSTSRRRGVSLSISLAIMVG